MRTCSTSVVRHTSTTRQAVRRGIVVIGGMCVRQQQQQEVVRARCSNETKTERMNERSFRSEAEVLRQTHITCERENRPSLSRYPARTIKPPLSIYQYYPTLSLGVVLDSRFQRFTLWLIHSCIGASQPVLHRIINIARTSDPRTRFDMASPLVPPSRPSC